MKGTIRAYLWTFVGGLAVFVTPLILLFIFYGFGQ